MPDSARDPVIDDGHWCHTSASTDVAVVPTRLTREYGLQHPFVGAGMGFIAHEHLAAAVTNAGGLGVLGASADPPGSLAIMVKRLRTLTSGPFGVDLIRADTGFGPASSDLHIDVCIQLNVPLVVFHHDPPPPRWVSTLRAAGIPVWMQASSPELASAAIELGVTGIVAQGSEAAGHARPACKPPPGAFTPRFRPRRADAAKPLQPRPGETECPPHDSNVRPRD